MGDLIVCRRDYGELFSEASESFDRIYQNARRITDKVSLIFYDGEEADYFDVGLIALKNFGFAIKGNFFVPSRTYLAFTIFPTRNYLVQFEAWDINENTDGSAGEVFGLIKKLIGGSFEGWNRRIFHSDELADYLDAREFNGEEVWDYLRRKPELARA